MSTNIGNDAGVRENPNRKMVQQNNPDASQAKNVGERLKEALGEANQGPKPLAQNEINVEDLLDITSNEINYMV